MRDLGKHSSDSYTIDITVSLVFHLLDLV